MEYKRIDENTIRCIITEEDMENFGLDLDEFLSHSQKSDEFLRHIVEEARDELGYPVQHGMVSMRLEVLSDNRISLTFASGNEKNILHQVMGHLQKIFPEVDKASLDYLVEQLSKIPENPKKEKVRKEKPEYDKDTYRLYEFASMNDAIEYCHAIGLKQPIRSHLYKQKNQYYLVVERYRISDYNYNLLTAIAFEYAKVCADPEAMLNHLMEYGELILENRAIGILRKI